jgi:hypothetical protein
MQMMSHESEKFSSSKIDNLIDWSNPRMDIKSLNECLVPLKEMKSFLIVHEDEKLVIKKLEQELLELKKLVDDLVKTYPHRINILDEKTK